MEGIKSEGVDSGKVDVDIFDSVVAPSGVDCVGVMPDEEDDSDEVVDFGVVADSNSNGVDVVDPSVVDSGCSACEVVDCIDVGWNVVGSIAGGTVGCSGPGDPDVAEM